MTWSENAISSNHGAHQRYDDDRFTREFFLDPKNLLTNPNYGVQPFEFSQQISQIVNAEEVREGFHYSPSFNGGLVELPDHLRSAF
jgi:hypothetical protein